jgi:branched-chain amino acid transport system ATP-binding protein
LLLNVENLTAGYGSITAIKGVNLHIVEGEVVSLIGANGGGKSTLLNSIARLIGNKEGKIEFNGEDITSIEPHLVIRKGLSLAVEGRGIFKTMSVHENLRVGAYCRRDHRQIADDMTRVLELFPSIKARLHQKACSLSGGEQQMLSIGRALMSRPRLLMLDEPSWGLSPLLVKEVFAICTRLCEDGTAVLIAEQDAFHALGCSHRGYVIENGKIVQSGSGKELLDNQEIKKYYLGM